MMFFLIVSGIVVGLVVGFFVGVGVTTRVKVNERLDAMGITRNTKDLLNDAVKMIKWLRTEEAAMSGIYYDSELRRRMDVFLEKIKKEYK